MARYQEIATDLRARIRAGEFPVGSSLPGISALQAKYEVAGLNTIRAAQQVLVEEGLLRTRQGVGVFVAALEPLTQPPDVLAELHAARNALTRAIAALEKGTSPTGPFRARTNLQVLSGGEAGDAVEVPGPGSVTAPTPLPGSGAVKGSPSREGPPTGPPAVRPGPEAGVAKRPRRRWHVVEAGDEDDRAAPVVIISSHASESAASNARARQASRAAAGVVLEVLPDEDISSYVEWDPGVGHGVVRQGPPRR